MKIISKVVLLTAVVGLSACSGSQFDDGNGTGGAGGLNNGAGAGTYDPASPEYFNQTVGDRVLFTVDQSNVTSQGMATLQAQAAWLQQNPNYSAIIEGHADEQGTREYNLGLGARRAAAARDVLVANGIADSRLRTVTFGKERPIQVCSSEVCYQQNRRAVTVISAGIGS